MQNSILNLVWLPFIISFIVTAIITPAVIHYTKKYKLMDDPNRKHPAILHKKPLPRGGGIALFFGCFVAAIFFLPWNNVTISIFIAAFLALVIGVIDDVLNAKSKDVSPYFRFSVNILCALIVVAAGVTVPYITNPFGGILHFQNISFPFLFGQTILLSQIVAVFWIVWVINMLNWSSGVDGQASGIVAISAIVIGILSVRFPITDPFVLIDAKLSFIIAGSSLGFLIYHFHPAKILPGYGATSLFLLVAVVSILSSSKLATAILVMGIPMIDAVFTIVRRVLTKHSPFLGDKKHLHHLLLQLGMSQRQIALFYWIISAILGSIALQLQSRSKIFALIMLIVLVSGCILFLHILLRNKNEKTTS